MQRVIVQVPMTKTLKEEAEQAARELGFSSMQEIIRVILTKLSKKQIQLTIEESTEFVHLSKAAEKRYKKAVQDIKAGKNIYKPKNKKEFFDLLNS